MNDIELWTETTKAIVSPQGAWLTNLSDDRGDIVFPKRQLTAPDGSQKARGGCHVCLPNFGPGGDSGLPQHGFGRLSIWQVAQQTETGVTLTLDGGAKGYEGLASRLTYTLADTSITMTLDLTNNGTTDLRAGPAFHPYFATQLNESRVIIDDQSVDLDDLIGTEFQTGDAKQLQTHRRRYRLQSNNMPTWALWTDRLAPYVCVEPTVGGYTFLRDSPGSDEVLVPGQTTSYQFTITW